MAKSVKLHTPIFRACYVQVTEPRGFEGSEPKYSVVAIFNPKKFSVADKRRWKELNSALDVVSLEAFKKGFKKLPKNFKLPLRSSDEKEGVDGFDPGTTFCTLSSKFKPGVVDAQRDPIMDADEFYSGCYARASVIIYSFDNIAKGLAIGLQNLMKVDEGERLDGRVSAEDDFADFGEEDIPEDEDE